jgi:hypothetical protein
MLVKWLVRKGTIVRWQQTALCFTWLRGLGHLENAIPGHL